MIHLRSSFLREMLTVRKALHKLLAGRSIDTTKPLTPKTRESRTHVRYYTLLAPHPNFTSETRKTSRAQISRHLIFHLHCISLQYPRYINASRDRNDLEFSSNRLSLSSYPLSSFAVPFHLTSPKISLDMQSLKFPCIDLLSFPRRLNYIHTSDPL